MFLFSADKQKILAVAKQFGELANGTTREVRQKECYTGIIETYKMSLKHSQCAE